MQGVLRTTASTVFINKAIYGANTWCKCSVVGILWFELIRCSLVHLSGAAAALPGPVPLQLVHGMQHCVVAKPSS
jgi:hypothetical protein